VVPNTFSGEPSIPPPLDRPRPPKATSPPTATSQRPLPAVTSLSEPSGPEPETAEVPIPRRVRVPTFCAYPSFECSLKCSLVSSSHRDGRESETAPRHHRDLAMMGQSWAHPQVLLHLLHSTWAMSLQLLLSYPPYVYAQFPLYIVCSRDCIMRSHYSPSLKRANSHPADEQTRASMLLPL
jgi:hypothetical protein